MWYIHMQPSQSTLKTELKDHCMKADSRMGQTINELIFQSYLGSSVSSVFNELQFWSWNLCVKKKMKKKSKV